MQQPQHPPLPMQANAKAKFDESVEIALNLGVDPRRGDQTVRGTVVLPHGTGKSVKVAVFAEGEDADAARAAGACFTLCRTRKRAGDVLLTEYSVVVRAARRQPYHC